jgi:hypothetical protein
MLLKQRFHRCEFTRSRRTSNRSLALFSSETSSSLPVSYIRFSSTPSAMVDDQGLREYLHRLFDICYQINGIYFAHDSDLYVMKLNDDTYFLTIFLQKILFENLNSLPSIRLRIVLRQFCRSFVENYCSAATADKSATNEVFLSFFDIFFPYIQQRLTTIWNTLLTTTELSQQQGQCSDEVIEECVCVLITRDFLDIIRYFIFKTTHSTISNGLGSMKKKNKTNVGRQHSESMCEDVVGNGDLDQTDEWDDQVTTNGISNKLLNSTQDRLEYSDLFSHLLKMTRESKSRSIN